MADRELVYRISVAGQSEAKAAIRSIVQEANRCANEEAKITRATVDAIIRERKRGSTAVRQVADADAQQEARMQQFLLRNAAKNFADLTRAHKKAEQDKTKAATAEAKQREQDAKAAGQRIVAAMNQEVRDFDKAEKAKTAIAKRERGEREREEKRAQAQSNRDAKQFARDRAFEERRLLKGIATGMSEGIGSGMRYSYGLAARGVRDVAGGMGMNRGWDLGDIASERAALSRTMRSVAIEARTAGSGFSFDEAGAKAKVASVARSSGFTQTELAGAIDAYSEKGSGATGVANLDKIAMQARAMGADPATVAKLRANLELKGMDAAGVDQFMARMHFVGKTGVFRAADLAQQSEMMLASFGPDIAKGGNQFLAFANEARKSTGSGAMARTAFDSALDTLDKKRGKIEGLGVKYEENGEARSKVDIIKDIIAATGGDKTALAKIFDPSRGGKAVTTLIDAFRGAGGGDAGRSAMDHLLAGDASLKNASLGEMQKDADAATSESSTKLAIKMEELRQKLAEKLLPIFDKLIDKLTKFVDSKLFSKGLDFVSENPKTALALGGLVAGFAPTLMQMGGNAAARFGAGMLVNTVPGLRKGGLGGGGGGGGIAGALSSALSGGGGGTPVFVTNWPGGGIGGGAGGDGIPGLKGASGLLGGEGALSAVGGTGGAATLGTAIGAAVGIAATAAIAVAVLENHDTAWRPKAGRQGTQADRDELDAARGEKKKRDEGILDIVENGGNFVETDAGRQTRVGKQKAREKVRNDKWLYEFLDKGYLGKSQGYSSPVTAEIAGGDGSRTNVANTPAGRMSGQGADKAAMEDFRKTLKAVGNDLDSLGRKAKQAQSGFSVLKAGPTLDR